MPEVRMPEQSPALSRIEAALLPPRSSTAAAPAERVADVPEDKGDAPAAKKPAAKKASKAGS